MKVSPSILSGDFLRLGEQVARVESWGADWLHLDVMDGLFVPNLTFGPPVIAQLRRVCGLPFDVHLMVREPHRLLEQCAAAGADSIGIHVESASPVEETLEAIRTLGCRAALALRPGTPVEAVLPYLERADTVLVMGVEPGRGGQPLLPGTPARIRALRREIDARGLPVLIQADGGIGRDNAAALAGAGLDVAVVGTALLGDADPAGMIRTLQAL